VEIPLEGMEGSGYGPDTARREFPRREVAGREESRTWL
jgi:hypothetical protein